MSSPWTEERLSQLEQLDDLLRQLESVNRGGGALDRLQSCVKVAEQLRASRLSPDVSMSFVHFLKCLAIESRMSAEETSD